MTKSAFKVSFFPTLLNNEGALKGLWSQSVALAKIDLVTNYYQQLSQPMHLFLSITEDTALLPVSLWKV